MRGGKELTGAMLGDGGIEAGAGSVGAGAGAGSTTIVGMLLWTDVNAGRADADEDAESDRFFGDCGSGMVTACSNKASCRSDAGAVPAGWNSGGDDAVAAPSCGGSDWPDWPARTNSSTSDGRAFSRGLSPSPACIQEAELTCSNYREETILFLLSRLWWLRLRYLVQVKPRRRLMFGFCPVWQV
jgi:hypothetical protein